MDQFSPSATYYGQLQHRSIWLAGLNVQDIVLGLLNDFVEYFCERFWGKSASSAKFDFL
jgi:hypothetical protein